MTEQSLQSTNVHWYQAGSEDIAEWDFQYLRGGVGNEWEWADSIGEVGTCTECFEAMLNLPSGVAAVRARSIGLDGGYSEWSSPTGVPEPSFLLMMMVGLVALVFLRGSKI